MLIKTGEIIVETATGREYVIEEIAPPTGTQTNTWVGFRNLATRRVYTNTVEAVQRDFHAKTSQ
jgi:hypothetical protein